MNIRYTLAAMLLGTAGLGVVATAGYTAVPCEAPAPTMASLSKDATFSLLVVRPSGMVTALDAELDSKTCVFLSKQMAARNPAGSPTPICVMED